MRFFMIFCLIYTRGYLYKHYYVYQNIDIQLIKFKRNQC